MRKDENITMGRLFSFKLVNIDSEIDKNEMKYLQLVDLKKVESFTITEQTGWLQSSSTWQKKVRSNSEN